MAIWIRRYTVTRSWGPLPCHHLMFQHDNAQPHVEGICTQFLEAENVPVLPWHTHRRVTHWACLGCSGLMCMTACSRSRQYPATLHSHCRGLGQHSTGHNQQLNQLCVKEMCGTTWGKLWSHQILTAFLVNAHTFFKSICDQQMHICIPSHVKLIY